ncbi:MAG: hydroxymethylpyrimidine/phosphomethylpyrimidine kinase [Steroidobacteraceae bacterium]
MTAVLVIAGTDSSGGAGLTRDACTLAHFNTQILCAVTAVTAQSHSALAAVQAVAPSLVRAQIATGLASGRVRAIKIGMLGTRATIEAVAESIPANQRLPLVLDPVLAASSGAELLDADGRRALLALLLPRATLLTPNIPEAAALLDARPASSQEELLAQARALCVLGAAAVLLKGGHGAGPAAVDWLVSTDGSVHAFTAPRSATQCRGTGCALAAGIAAGLAANVGLIEACERSKRHVTELLQHGLTRRDG